MDELLSLDHAISALISELSRVSGVAVSEISSETRLDDLGIDSLLMAEMIISVEESLGIEIPGDVLGTVEVVDTVGDLEDLLRRTFELMTLP